MRANHSRFSTADLVTAAALAGGGATAADIAIALGRGMTAADVYALLHRYGVRLVPKARTEVAFVIVIDRAAFEAIEAAAAERGADPHALAGRALETVAARPDLVRLLSAPEAHSSEEDCHDL